MPASSAPSPIRRVAPRAAIAAAAVLSAAGAAAAPAAAQGPGAATPPAAAFDTAGLADGPYSRACMLLERTIFRVDVLTLELRFGPATADSIRGLAQGGADRGAVAAVAMRSRNAFARIVFVRDVGMDRFLEGVRGDLRPVWQAGLIDRATHDEISSSLPVWYGFLEDRGVREGDELLYRIRGDTLHSGYRTRAGEWLMRMTHEGPQRRLSVPASYLVEGSSFRERVLDSLLSGDGC